MRKLGMNIVLFILLLLPMTAVPVQAMDDMNIMAEFISGGHLVNGEDYADQNPYMGYSITNVKQNNVTIGNDDISTDFSKYYDGMMGYDEELPIPEYSFTVELSEGHSILQPSGGEGNQFYAYRTLDSGEFISGELILEPETQSLKGLYSPTLGHELIVDFHIDATYRYTFRYQYIEKATSNLIDEEEQGTISLNFDRSVTYYTSYSGRTNLSFMEEKYPLNIAKNDAIFYAESEAMYADDIIFSGESYTMDGELIFMPLVVRDASFNAIGMINDTEWMEPDGMEPGMSDADRMNEVSDEKENLEPDGMSSATVAALMVAASAAAAAVVAAGASGVISSTSGMMASTSTSGVDSTTFSESTDAKEDLKSVDKNTENTTWYDSLMDWLKEKGSGFELVINEGVDLPEMLCKEGNVIEIPVRVDGGENGNWLFFAGCICGKENKKLIKTMVIPYGGGSGMITMTLKGDEIDKKETVYCTITAIDADTMQIRDLSTCDFNLVTEEEYAKKLS